MPSRSIVTPIPGRALLDGAMFLLVYGANPEVAVLIEASRQRNDTPAWRYGFARIAGAELHVDVDGREAWTKPAVGNPGARDLRVLHQADRRRALSDKYKG